jgi:DNA mismatch repair protein MutS
MRQYLGIKRQYPDAVLMFRMGDFYEMFFEDALAVGPILDIAVTTRDKRADDPVPMAGVPYHAIGGYLRTLVERGVKVAICEQMETPAEAKKRKGPKIVRREVVRVVSPGALLDEDHLERERANFLVAVVPEKTLPGAAGVAALDISSGEFEVVWTETGDALRTELARLEPSEILVDAGHHGWMESTFGPELPRLEPAGPSPDLATRRRVDALRDDGAGGAELREQEREAAARVLAYAEFTQPGQTLLLHRLRSHDPSAHMRLDDASLRNLEVFRTLRDGNKKGTLLWAVDATKTAMGARLLRGWLAAPAAELSTIVERHDGVEALVREPVLRDEIQSRLADVRDVVRLAARARLKTIGPRELAALRESLRALPVLAECLDRLAGRRIESAVPAVLEIGEDLLEDLAEDLARTLVGDPPAITREGGMIRSDADEVLGTQRELRDGARKLIADIETREREATGISNLKVLHNRVFGYFLEVSKSQLSRVPESYVRKQTLANAERYVTEELAQLESKVLAAQSEALAREMVLYEALRERVSQAGERLIAVGDRLARVDVIAGLATVAERHDFVRPTMVDEPVLDIREGRHPVVERMLARGSFVPNDVALASVSARRPDIARLWLITGPNMGGKSTVMRQVALTTMLAHAGSFVPAASATIGLCDRIFTRVGAADDLGRGDSTFMVEMRETAQILSQASARSLVLLDEVGRGTATFDGLALAWAITEHLHDQIGCRTMFATHYHELCGLAAKLAGVENMHVAVDEHRGRIVFLHRLAPGAAGRSYGIQVGRLAGLPRRVLRRAQRVLERLEAQESASDAQLDLFARPALETHASARSESLEEVLSLLDAADPDDMTPREAHALVCRLRDRLDRLDASDPLDPRDAGGPAGPLGVD